MLVTFTHQQFFLQQEVVSDEEFPKYCRVSTPHKVLIDILALFARGFKHLEIAIT